jgi:magnesium transporter
MSAGLPLLRDTAGEHLLCDVLTAAQEDTVADVLQRLRVAPPHALANVYVTDGAGRLVGQVPLGRLLAMPHDTRVGACAAAPSASAEPATDQEHVASLAVESSLGEVPVVGNDGTLLGIVPAPALVDILRREHIEDMRRFAGVLKEDERATRALQIPPLRRLYERLPWLLVGLVGSLFATALMASFERVLSAFQSPAMNGRPALQMIRGGALPTVPRLVIIASQHPVAIWDPRSGAWTWSTHPSC